MGSKKDSSFLPFLSIQYWHIPSGFPSGVKKRQHYKPLPCLLTVIELHTFILTITRDISLAKRYLVRKNTDGVNGCASTQPT